MDVILFYSALLPISSFVCLGAVFHLLERTNPARVTNWRRTFGLDLLGLSVVWTSTPIVTALTAAAIAACTSSTPHYSSATAIPRALAYFVLSDVARFATHRAMHTPMFWRVHRFHHTPTQLYWFSGNRATPTHVFLFLAPQLFFGWLFAIGPILVFINVFIGQVMNNVMHANWNWDARWQRRCEWLFTTPRYHAIHHSRDAAFANKNLASIFTIWDRLLRTYVDPDRVNPADLDFGSDAETPRYRVVLGL
jgi:sterol desaturase/sphingolipid hydroxylase (fatty acid hydroxylase superfamily)